LKKVFYFILSALAIFLVVFCMAGLLSDAEHRGTATAVVDAPVDSIWSLLNDVERYSGIRHEVKKVELLAANQSGFPVWYEHTGIAGKILLEITGREPKESLEVHMIKSDFGMHGIWHFELEPEGSKTKVTIYEHSFTNGFIMRSILSLVGRNGNIMLQMRAIKKGISGKSGNNLL
jgi:hypothetical protein